MSDLETAEQDYQRAFKAYRAADDKIAQLRRQETDLMDEIATARNDLSVAHRELDTASTGVLLALQDQA